MGKKRNDSFARAGDLMTLRQIANDIAQNDRRCAAYLYHAALVAARDLGIYGRNREYSLDEALKIQKTLYRLFPGRDRSQD